ncbi:MAG TPA: hypothetical protein VL501_02505 [Pyrinomonadaceae bacterium]|nr:hypothetical protein [Pyrinomonadaceae bacterium]
MKKSLLSILLVALAAVCVSAQKTPPVAPAADTVAADNAAALVTAKAALAAHGGDKFKQMKSLVMKGSADINVSNQIQPGAFSTAFSGNKYYFEVAMAVQSFKQVSDGVNTSSSVPGILLPPVTSMGFPVLAHVGDAGYLVTKFGGAKKKPGFRITTPEGYYTDFWVDEKTGQVKGFESAYNAYGRDISTSAEIEDVQTVDGIVFPKKYSQRFDLGAFTAYATFKAKDILVNTALDDAAFVVKQ